jgi:hypothetical protein
MVGAEERLQKQRFEFKYLVNESVALAVRDFVGSYLKLDEYGETQPNLSYPVHSLYLDSPDLNLYQATINGNKNRLKLRVRFYENRPDAPVYFEIKRRVDDTIHKERAAVHRGAASLLLGGQWPGPEHVAKDAPEHLAALQNFARHVSQLQARPRTHVAYLREAWRCREGNSVRVTIDRNTLSEVRPRAELLTHMERPRPVFGSLVVLELKFTGRFPDWFGELVRVFNLTRCSAAKYADGVTRLGADVVSNSFALVDNAERATRRLERVDRKSRANGVSIPAMREAGPSTRSPQA